MIGIDWFMKEGDLLPEFGPVTLTDANGAVNLTTASAVRFRLRAPGLLSAAVVDAAATVVTASSGIVKYVWASGDTATPGQWYADFRVTWGDGRLETFPNDGYLVVEIESKLA